MKGDEKQVTHSADVCGHAENEAGSRSIQEKNINIDSKGITK